MKLAHIKLSNFRSFLDEHQFEIAYYASFFVGPNNCGKSNLLSALELSMDPEAVLVPERARPAATQGVGGLRQTRITLTFRSTDKIARRPRSESQRSLSGGDYDDKPRDAADAK
jgi:putative ATP-dependent endonuclease of OLD family